MKNLPKTVTETLFISICNITDSVIVTVYPVPGCVVLGTADVTVDVPQLTEHEINQQHIASLIAQADEIKATTSKRLQEISEQISKLTCIEHQEPQS